MTKKIYYLNTAFESVSEYNLALLVQKYSIAFLFHSPTGQNIYAFDSISQLKPGEQNENQFTAVAKWQNYLFSKLEPLNAQILPQIVGSFSFTSEQQNSEIWESLTNGFFFLPKFLVIVEKKNFTLVTCSFTKNTIIQESTAFLRLLGTVDTKKKPYSNLITKTEELAVTKWKDAVAETTKLIKETNLKKVVLARSLKVEFIHEFKVHTLWKKLKDTQPNTYRILLKQNTSLFISATPERLAKFSANQFETVALAGTIKRGDTLSEDAELGKKLITDPKNRGEQQFVVNTISEILKKTGLIVNHPQNPILLKNKNVQHLYTPITGMGFYNLFSLLGELHPTPALGGLPKADALKQINKVEPFIRGLFGAPVGHISFDNSGELAVGIRSGILKANKAFLFAGAGIVAGSIPENEVKETRMKFQPILQVLEGVSHSEK